MPSSSISQSLSKSLISTLKLSRPASSFLHSAFQLSNSASKAAFLFRKTSFLASVSSMLDERSSALTERDRKGFQLCDLSLKTLQSLLVLALGGFGALVRVDVHAAHLLLPIARHALYPVGFHDLREYLVPARQHVLVVGVASLLHRLVHRVLNRQLLAKAPVFHAPVDSGSAPVMRKKKAPV